MGGEVMHALGYIALGMMVSEVYNLAMWRKYREGLRNGNNAADQHQQYNTSRYGGGRPR